MTKFQKRRSPSPRRREELPHPTTHQSVRCGIRLLATEIQVTGGAESEYTLQRGRGGVRVHASERSCGIRQHTAECSTRHPTTRRRDSSYRWRIRIHTAEGRGGVVFHAASDYSPQGFKLQVERNPNTHRRGERRSPSPHRRGERRSPSPHRRGERRSPRPHRREKLRIPTTRRRVSHPASEYNHSVQAHVERHAQRQNGQQGDLERNRQNIVRLLVTHLILGSANQALSSMSPLILLIPPSASSCWSFGQCFSTEAGSWVAGSGAGERWRTSHDDSRNEKKMQL